MKTLIVGAAVCALALGAGTANAEIVSGKVKAVNGALQVITLDNGQEYKLGGHTRTEHVWPGDSVKIDWIGHLKGYRLAERVWVENRK